LYQIDIGLTMHRISHPTKTLGTMYPVKILISVGVKDGVHVALGIVRLVSVKMLLSILPCRHHEVATEVGED
jgi:hypothetical protein